MSESTYMCTRHEALDCRDIGKLETKITRLEKALALVREQRDEWIKQVPRYHEDDNISYITISHEKMIERCNLELDKILKGEE